MKRKVTASVLVSGMIVSLLFSGCSGKPSEKAKEGGDKKVTLDLCYWGSPVEKKAMEESLKGFTEKYGIDVNGQYIPDADYTTKMSAMMAGGNTPDIAYMTAGQAFPWAEEGKLYNIYDLIEKDENFELTDLAANVWYEWEEGKSFGCNTALETYGIFYNKDLFDKAGVAYPPSKIEEALSWDEFVELAKKVTFDENGNNAASPDFDPENIKQYGVNMGTGLNSYMNFVFQNGGDFLTEDGKEFAFSSEEALDALQKCADLINVHHVAPSPVAQKALPAPSIALQTGQIAMSIEGQWTALDLGESGMNFGAACLPKMGKEYRNVVNGGATVIFADTEYPEEAWLLYKWFADPENSLDLHKKGLWMPLMKEWYTDEEKLKLWATDNAAHPEGYVDCFVEGVLKYSVRSPEFYVKNNAKINSLLTPALDAMWMGEKSAKEAIEEITPAINAEIKGRYAGGAYAEAQ